MNSMSQIISNGNEDKLVLAQSNQVSVCDDMSSSQACHLP